MNFSVFIVSFFTWLVLTWSLDWQEVLIGLIVSLVVSMLFKKYYRIHFNGKVISGLFRFVFLYIPVFIWEMIKANVDVASRVLTPGRNVKPGFVKVK
ncbi:MAG: Na+/H+ antiporter subunit E, partial [Fervidobacterium sp.]